MVRCVRCRRRQWVPDPLIPLDDKGYLTGPPVPLALPYTCLRCQEALGAPKTARPYRDTDPLLGAENAVASAPGGASV